MARPPDRKRSWCEQNNTNYVDLTIDEPPLKRWKPGPYSGSDAATQNASNRQQTAVEEGVKAMSLSACRLTEPTGPMTFDTHAPSARINGYNAIAGPPFAEVRVNTPQQPARVEKRDLYAIIKDDVQLFRTQGRELFEELRIKPFDDSDPALGQSLDKGRQPKHKAKKTYDLNLRPSQSLKGAKLPVEIFPPDRQGRFVLRKRVKRLSSITIASRVKGRQLNGKFQFIDEYIVSRKAQVSLKTKQINFPTRRCPHSDVTQPAAGFGRDAGGRQTDHYRDGRVTEAFMQRFQGPTPAYIQECSKSCTTSCPNRVVQAGRQLPLQIFETKLCGFGVRSPREILRGQFIDVYLGEVLTNDELLKREMAADEDTPSYVLSLDHFVQDVSSVLHIDGSNYGSPMRFVNHSCQPNCTTLPVVLPSDNKLIYHVGFFAIKDIPANTELTIDYDPSLTKPEEEEIDPSVVKCECQSPNCRTILWAPGKEKHRRRRLFQSSIDD